MQETKERGFTLVELAIVLTIIGLLVGGVIKGSEMIEMTRLKRTVSDIQSITAARLTFEDKYSQMPGDMRNATTRLDGCLPANECYDGNADGLLQPTTNRVWTHNVDLAADFTLESVLFWKHLAMADLITTVQPHAQVIQAGVSHPVPPASDGVYHVYSTNADPAFPNHKAGNVLSIRRSMHPNYNLTGRNPLTAKQAEYIDRLMDDGDGMAGDVISEAPGNLNVGCDNDGSYNIGDPRKNCELYVYMD